MTDHQPRRIELRRPPRLRRGDRVALLTPSSPSNIERIDEGIDVLRFCGLEPVELPTARARAATHSHLAGTDDDRASRPAGGAARRDRGRRAHRRRRLRLPADAREDGLDRPRCRRAQGRRGLLRRDRPPGGAREQARVGLGDGADGARGGVPRGVLLLRRSGRASPHRAYGPLAFPDGRTLVGGAAEGITAGGNLSLLTGSVGTSTSWTPPGGIVLVEDENEDAPRTDIMLTHLRPPGYFATRRRWSRASSPTRRPSARSQAVLDDRLGDLGIPVITGVNLGHGGHVQTWPLGVRARLDADARTVTFLEPPLA